MSLNLSSFGLGGSRVLLTQLLPYLSYLCCVHHLDFKQLLYKDLIANEYMNKQQNRLRLTKEYNCDKDCDLFKDKGLNSLKNQNV